MPCTWWYISGCPCPEQCNKRKTTGIAKKLTFSGRSPEEAISKCATHLVQSGLHNKSKREATELASAAPMLSYEEDTDDEAVPLQQGEAHDTKTLSSDSEEFDEPQPLPMRKKQRLAIGAPPAASRRSPDPLVAELSATILHEMRGSSSSGIPFQLASTDQRGHHALLRAARRDIQDSEAAAKKAHDIAVSAMNGFAEVQHKLNKAWKALSWLENDAE